MKKIVLTLLVYSIAYAHAQNRQIDSLQNILKEAKPDTNRVNALVQLSQEYFSLSSYDLSTLYACKAKELSKKINYTAGEINALNIVGAAHFNKTEYRDAQHCYDSALKMLPAAGADVLRYKLCFNMAKVDGARGFYQEALAKYKPCVTFYNKTKDLAALANCYNNMGYVYSRIKNQNDSAIINYTQALKLFGQLDDKNNVACTYLNLGNVYLNTSDFEKSNEHLAKSMALYRQNSDSAGVAAVYLHLGALFLKQNKYEEALLNYEEAEKHFAALSNTYNEAKAQFGMCQSFSGLEKHNQALEYGEKSAKNALQSGNRECLRLVYKLLSTTEEKLKHHKKALEYYKSHIALRDSLLAEENIRRIEQMRLQAEADKQNAVLAMQQQQNQTEGRQQIVLKEMEAEHTKLLRLFAGIGLVLLLLLTYFFMRFQRLKARIKTQGQQKSNEAKA